MVVSDQGEEAGEVDANLEMRGICEMGVKQREVK